MPRLTVDVARRLTFQDLNDAVYGLIQPFEKGHEQETGQEREDRIGRTLDEAPDVYAWILNLHAYFDRWTDEFAEQFGRQDPNYKVMRAKRDLCDKAASACKLRYDGASRRITQLERHEGAADMRRGR